MTSYSPQWKEMLNPGTYTGRDIEYFQGMYPRRIKELQKYVARQCDIMDYAGSPIYDEYPDAVMIDQTCRMICQNLPEEWQSDGLEREDQGNRMGEEPADLYEAGDPPKEIQQQSMEGISDSSEGFLGNILGAPPGFRPPGWNPPPGPPGWNPPPGPPGGRPGGPGNPPGFGPPPGPPGWNPPPGPPGGPPPGPPPGPRPSGNPRDGLSGPGNWIPDIIKVLFMNELQRRRCRSGLC